MNEDNTISFLIVGAIIAMISFTLGSLYASSRLQQAAVLTGNAVWSSDSNGRSVFKWKEASK